MRNGVTIVLCLFSVSLSGCGNLARMARVNPASVVSQRQPETCKYTKSLDGGRDFAIDLDCYRFPGQASSTAYLAAETSIQSRNRLEAVLLRQADSICEVEKGYIFANEATTNTLFDFLATGLSATSTIVSGEQAKSILSGLAGLSTASKTNITSNVYKNQIVPAITNVMDGERQRILTLMVARRTEDYVAYPVDEMIRMANSYHQACSFQNGIQLLLKASVNKAGSDAIIKSINLQFAIDKLKSDIDAYSRLPNPDAASLKSMSDKLVQLQLERAANAQVVQGTSVTNTADTVDGS